jgi:hypothetical protein
MRLSAAALLAAALLASAGCAAPPPPEPETAAQGWYTAKAAYAAALAEAARYRADCQRKVERLQARCMAVVDDLRRVDREAEGVEEIGDLAHAEGDDALMEKAAAELERLRDDFEESLLDAREETK